MRTLPKITVPEEPVTQTKGQLPKLNLTGVVPEKDEKKNSGSSGSGFSELIWGPESPYRTGELNSRPPSAPVFPAGYAEKFKQVDPTQLRRVVGFQGYVPGMSPDQMKSIEDMKKAGAAVKSQTEAAKTPEGRAEAAKAVSTFKSNTQAPQPKIPEVAALPKPAQEGPSISANDDLDRIAKEQEKFEILGTQVPVIGPLINEFVKGGIAGLKHTMDFADGVEEIVNDAISSATGLDLSGDGVFKMASDYLSKYDAEWTRPLVFGSETATDVTRALGEFVPMLATMELAPAAKIADVAIPKFVTYMASSEGAVAYKDAKDNGGDILEAVTKGIDATAKGAASGMLFELFGYKAGEIAKTVVEMGGSPLGATVASTAANATGFVAAGDLLTELSGGEYKTGDATRDALVAVALGAKSLKAGIKESLAHTIMSRATKNYLSVDPMRISPELRSEVSKSPSKMRDKALALRDEAESMPDSPKREAKIIAANAIDTMVDAVVMGDVVSKNRKEFKEVVEEDPTLSRESKDVILKQIDKSANSKNENFEQIQKVSSEIDALKKEATDIESDTVLSKEAKEAALSIKTKQIEDKVKEMEKLHDAPATVKVESRDDYVRSLTEVSKLDQDTIDKHMAVADQMAKNWSAETGRPESEFFPETFSEVRNNTAAINEVANNNNIDFDAAKKLLTSKTGKVKGTVQFDKDNKAVVTVYENADSSTRAHEDLAHPYMQRHVGQALRGSKESADVIGTVVDSYNSSHKRKISVEGVLSGKGRDFIAAHEHFADGFESRISGDKAPEKMTGVYEKFTNFIKDTYNALSGRSNPSDGMQELYDKAVSVKPAEPDAPPADVVVNPDQTPTVETSRRKMTAEQRKEAERADDQLRDTIAPTLRARTKSLLDKAKVPATDNPEVKGGSVKKVANTLSGLLVRADQMWMDKISSKLADKIATVYDRMISSRYKGLRTAVHMINGIVPDSQLTFAQRTDRDVKNGGVNVAINRSLRLYDSVVKMLGHDTIPSYRELSAAVAEAGAELSKSDYKVAIRQMKSEAVSKTRDSLRRIHTVMDPDFYKELTIDEFSKRLEDSGIDVSKKSVEWIEEKFSIFNETRNGLLEKTGGLHSYESLSPSEQAVHDILRETLDLIHDVSFVNKHIDGEVYAKYKGTYIPRIYDRFESKEDADMNKFLSDKIVSGIYKQREDVDAWKLTHIMQDPVFAASKRFAQVMGNKAIVDYAQKVIRNKNYVSSDPKPGYIELGRNYGFKNGTYVRADIAEHFKGYVAMNNVTENLVKWINIYGDLPPRVAFKKMLTIYNPGVRIGNVTGNAFFATACGINPVRYTYEYLNMAKDAYMSKEAYTELFDYLTSQGVIDHRMVLDNMRSRVNEASSVMTDPTYMDKLKKLDAKYVQETYQMVDAHAKMAAFKSLKDLGLTNEQALKRVADAFQNMSRVGFAYKTSSKIPLIGPAFGSFAGSLQTIIRTRMFHSPVGTASVVALWKGLATLASMASTESDDDRKVREGRKGAPRIPFPDMLGGDIPLEYKIGDQVINMARFFSPLYIYSGDSDDAWRLLGRVLPMYFERSEDGDVQKSGIQTAMMNVKDPMLAPIIGGFVGFDWLGNYIPDPTVSDNESLGTLTEGQMLTNRLRYVAKGYIPFGSMIDDVVRVSQTGKDYYGRDRTVGQVLARFSGYNAQLWDKSRYQQVIEKPLAIKLAKLSDLCASKGDMIKTFNEFDPEESIVKVYSGKLAKHLMQDATSVDEVEVLKESGKLIPNSTYRVGKKYYKATSNNEYEETANPPFKSIPKSQYDKKVAEEMGQIVDLVEEITDYMKKNASRIDQKRYEELIKETAADPILRKELGIPDHTEEWYQTEEDPDEE